MMAWIVYWINVGVTALFDRLQMGVDLLGDWGLALWALLLGSVSLWGWARFSDQQAVRRSREKVQGEILGLRLFQHDLRVFFGLQGHILRDTAGYLARGLRPALWLAIPVGLCLLQLQARYSPRPLQPGEAALVKVRLADEALLAYHALTLQVDEGLEVETPGVRSLADREIAWRIRARAAGVHRLTVRSARGELEKKVLVGAAEGLIAEVRTAEGWFRQLLHPGAPPLERGAGLLSVQVVYPRRMLVFWTWKGEWGVPFVVFFLLFGYLLKRFWKVEI